MSAGDSAEDPLDRQVLSHAPCLHCRVFFLEGVGLSEMMIKVTVIKHTSQHIVVEGHYQALYAAPNCICYTCVSLTAQ